MEHFPSNFKKDLKIEGVISYIVPFTQKHLMDSKYIGWLHDYDVIKTLYLLSYIEKPVTKNELRDYFKRVTESNNDMFFALYAKNDDEFIGTIKIAKIDWRHLMADVGIMIGDKEYWGMGIATDSIRSVCKYLFNELNMRKLTAGLMEVNPAMKKVFEKLGFIIEGEFRKTDYYKGKYFDHIYMGCFKEEFHFD